MAGELTHTSVGAVCSQAEFEDTALHTMTWTDWTPTITQSTTVTFMQTYAKYARLGKLCHVIAVLSVTSTGVAGNGIAIGNLPVAPVANVTLLGNGYIIDVGTAQYAGAAIYTASAVYIAPHNNGTGVYVGLLPNIGLSSGDTVHLNLSYPTT